MRSCLLLTRTGCWPAVTPCCRSRTGWRAFSVKCMQLQVSAPETLPAVSWVCALDACLADSVLLPSAAPAAAATNYACFRALSVSLQPPSRPPLSCCHHCCTCCTSSPESGPLTGRSTGSWCGQRERWEFSALLAPCTSSSWAGAASSCLQHKQHAVGSQALLSLAAILAALAGSSGATPRQQQLQRWRLCGVLSKHSASGIWPAAASCSTHMHRPAAVTQCCLDQAHKVASRLKACICFNLHPLSLWRYCTLLVLTRHGVAAVAWLLAAFVTDTACTALLTRTRYCNFISRRQPQHHQLTHV